MKLLRRIPALEEIFKHPAKGDVSALVISQFAFGLMGLMSTIVAARALGPLNYGTAALMIAYPSIATSLASLKSAAVTTRYLSTYWTSGDVRNFRTVASLGYVLDVGLAAVAFLLVALTASMVLPLFTDGDAALAIVFSASLVVYSVVSPSSAVLSSMRRFKLAAWLRLMEGALLSGAVIGALVFKATVSSYVFAISASNAITGLVMGAVAGSLYLSKKEAVAEDPPMLVRALALELRPMLGWNWLAQTVGGLAMQGPLFLLGRFRSQEEVGFFRAALALMLGGSFLEGSLGRVVYPSMSSRWSNGEFTSVRESIRRWTFSVGLPLSTLIFSAVLFLPFIIRVVFGPGFLPMTTGARLMLATAGISLCFFYLIHYFYSTGEIRAWAIASTVYALSLILIGYPAIRSSGFVGAAVVTSLGTIALNLGMAWFAWRRATIFSLSESHR